jgi:hypothetical protein
VIKYCFFDSRAAREYERSFCSSVSLLVRPRAAREFERVSLFFFFFFFFYLLFFFPFYLF